MPPPRKPHFKTAFTIVCAVLLGLGLIAGYASSGDPLDAIEDPGRTVVHLFERTLEAERESSTVPLSDLLALPGETAQGAEAAYREVIVHLDDDGPDGATGREQADRVRTHLVVLLGEDGRFAEAEEALVRLDASALAGAAEFAMAARVAYGGAEKPTARPRPDLPADGWARRRLFERLGWDSQQGPTTRMLLAAGIGSAWAVLVGFGLFLAIGLLLAPSGGPAPASGHVPAPWPPRDGYAVLLRGPLYGVAFLMAVVIAALVLEPDTEGFPLNQASLLAFLPLMVMIVHWLLRPKGLGLLDAFGLRGPGRGMLGLPVVGLATLGVDQLGGFGIAHACAALSIDWHWAEGVDETMFFGSTGDAVLMSIDTALWAPLFEEIAFRGVLYATLRVRLRPLPAAALSAVLFSAIHFYSLPGFLTIIWSGFVWAFAYEWSRSLWPCIFAHAMHNGILVAQVFAVYR